MTLCTSATFADMVRGRGLAYGPMSDGFIELMTSFEGRSALERMGTLTGAFRSVVNLARSVGPLQLQMLEDVWRVAKKAKPDVVVVHPKVPGGLDIADELNVPAIIAPLFPQYVATSAFPAIGFPDLPLGSAYRLATYKLVSGVTNLLSRGPIHAWRRNNELERRPKHLRHGRDRHGELIPAVHGFSASLCSRPADWPESAMVAGPWSLKSESWKPPAALLKFLADGATPVYVGFGSMAGRKPRELTGIVLEALALSGQRGVIATGWGGLTEGQLPGTVFAVRDVPHSWLFPRVSAVVHHGGAGTTTAGLRAGCPTVVCPFFADQPFWGRRIHALGAGPRPIPQRRLTAPRLADAITSAVHDVNMRVTAGLLKQQLAAESRLDRTVALIESLSASGRCAAER